MSGVGGNLGPGKVQTSNVLQIMECVFSYGLWGFLFLRGIFCLLPCSVLFLIAFKYRFLAFFLTATAERAEQWKHSVLFCLQ